MEIHRIKYFFGVSALFIFLFIFIVSVGCTTNCADSEKCNGLCYNPKTQACCNGTLYEKNNGSCRLLLVNNSSQIIFIPQGYDLCGDILYKMWESQDCDYDIALNPHPPQLVSKGYGLCNGILYNESTQVCVFDEYKGRQFPSSYFVVDNGMGMCNGKQFNTRFNSCCNGQILVGNWSTCGEICYNKDTSICPVPYHTGKWMVYPKINNIECPINLTNRYFECPGSSKCCNDYRYGHICYDPRYETCNPI